MNVLYIEDHEPTAFILKDRCKGLSMENAPTLVAARTQIALGSFDVLLVDLNLPDSKGTCTMRAVMDYDLPVVVLTADTSPEFRSEAWRLGVADYISKDALLSVDIEERLRAAHENYQRIKRRYSSLSFANLDSFKPYISCPPFVTHTRAI